MQRTGVAHSRPAEHGCGGEVRWGGRAGVGGSPRRKRVRRAVIHAGWTRRPRFDCTWEDRGNGAVTPSRGGPTSAAGLVWRAGHRHGDRPPGVLNPHIGAENDRGYLRWGSLRGEGIW